MRSAETSDAGARGFGTGKNAANFSRTKPKPLASRRSFRHRFSPVTTAVAITSTLAATLFVAYDTVRTFEEIQRTTPSITAAASPLVTLPASAASAGSDDFAKYRFGAVIRASFVSAEQTPVSASTLLKPFAPRREPVAAAASTSGSVPWLDLAERAGLAFGLAGLFTFLSWRPRKNGMPDRQQQRNYRTLAQAIPMGVACWTKSGQLVVCNQQYTDRLNLGTKPVSYHEAVKRLIVGGYMKLLNDDSNNRLLELHREDGSCLLIDERPLEDGGFMTLLSDVTERKKTDTMLNAIREEQRHLARRYHEEKLKAEAASRSKTNFLAHLSHDIRTPLNHIIGFAELMRHQAYGPLGDARYAEYVQSIKTSGEHLLASFATILDLAELDSGQKALRTDPVAIDQVMASVVQRFRGQAERAGIRFQLGQSCGAIVQGDRLGLTRMIANIVENSLRFTEAGGRITLAGFAARDGVVIEITDTGIGMDEERLASLSQPFALGDATFTREGRGPGLGISIARAIAELTGGHLAIDSSLSLGTTVAISLPLNADEQRQAAE